MWLTHYLGKTLLNATFSSRLQVKSSRSSKFNKKDASFFAQAEVVNYLMASCATDDVILETVSNTVSFTQKPKYPRNCPHRFNMNEGALL